MKIRNTGYYWCKYDGDWYIGEYEWVDIYKEYLWWVIGFHEPFKESDLECIDEKIIPKHS